MHIDFVSPSNGTYNNAGRGRLLANYLEHEDLERIEKGIYTERSEERRVGKECRL